MSMVVHGFFAFGPSYETRYASPPRKKHGIGHRNSKLLVHGTFFISVKFRENPW